MFIAKIPSTSGTRRGHDQPVTLHDHCHRNQNLGFSHALASKPWGNETNRHLDYRLLFGRYCTKSY
ncbi:hypothetical protein HMPREF9573_01864 [Cutibacterium acnes HL072PA2]|nr:hypothetical protein HMPREF9573_01864 [Cutibacterium acnes HL072PA2]